MAKVYKILPNGDRQEIETLEGLAELDPESEEVQLIIEDKLDGEISYDNGERYIFGGDTGPGRWVSVQGVKAWYNPDSVSYSQQSFDTIFNKNGNNYMYKENIIEDFAENLYWNLSFEDTSKNTYSLQTQATVQNVPYLNTSGLYYKIDLKIIPEEGEPTTENLRVNATPLEMQNTSGEEVEINKLTYCGYIPVVIQVTENKEVKLQFLAIGCDNNKKMMPLYYTYGQRGETSAIIQPDTGGSLNYYFVRYQSTHDVTSQTPYILTVKPTDLEYLYIMGLTTVYKQATYQDARNAIIGDSNE